MINTELEKLSNLEIVHQPVTVFHTMCTARGRVAAPKGKDRSRQGGREIPGVVSLKPRSRRDLQCGIVFVKGWAVRIQNSESRMTLCWNPASGSLGISGTFSRSLFPWGLAL